MKRSIGFLFLFVCLCVFLPAAAAPAQSVEQWLVLGPAGLGAQESVLLKDTAAMAAADLLDIGAQSPQTGQSVQWTNTQVLRWSAAPARFAAANQPRLVYLAVYLEANRWQKNDLVWTSTFPFTVYCDGVSVGEAAAAREAQRRTLRLENGKHLLFLKGVLPAGDQEHVLQAALEAAPGFPAEPLALSLVPTHRVTMGEVIDTVNVTSFSVSPDGRYTAVHLSQYRPETKANVSWTEILQNVDGALVYTSAPLGALNDFTWLGDSRRYSFTRQEKEETAVYIAGVNNVAPQRVLGGIRDFSACVWADDGSYLLYAVGAPRVDTGKGYKFVKEIADRSAYPRQVLSWTIYYPAAKVKKPLADHLGDFDGAQPGPDPQRILLTQTREDARNRPYQIRAYYLYEAGSQTLRKLFESPWITDAMWAPDGNRLLLTGGASAFDGLGRNLKSDVIPNDYDNQVYIYHLADGKVVPITKEFDPAVSNTFWTRGDRALYLRVTDGQTNRVYRYLEKEKKFVRLPLPVDDVAQVDFARQRLAVFLGSGLGQPHKLYRLDTGNNKTVLLKDYNSERFTTVVFGKNEDWSFKTSSGKVISGYIVYPPDFQPQKKYPCIVNYYGGTSPVSRDFGGRYPKDWYAANGYIVYVLQPSGSYGFGQDFSAVHVNDWGMTTAQEILEGVEQLIQTHPFIDPRRIGAIGASYGGFMTLYLAAKTDRFAAFISHAGISSLASYWGVGDWGYTYSGVATAQSFPWNRKDIYVGQSPLFMAERVTKPVLLTHGDADNNVPPGESYQMFAALKMQGKEVALLTFAGQQHFILEHDKRMQWMRSIIAWWDKWLKGQPEHWDEMYGSK